MSDKKNIHGREGDNKMPSIGETDLDPFGRKNEENPGNIMGPNRLRQSRALHSASFARPRDVSHPEISGSLLGPKHPLFGIEDPTKKGETDKTPFGEKFDPFGPPNVKSFGDPNNNHLKPPE